MLNAHLSEINSKCVLFYILFHLNPGYYKAVNVPDQSVDGKVPKQSSNVIAKCTDPQRRVK